MMNNEEYRIKIKRSISYAYHVTFCNMLSFGKYREGTKSAFDNRFNTFNLTRFSQNVSGFNRPLYVEMQRDFESHANYLNINTFLDTLQPVETEDSLIQALQDNSDNNNINEFNSFNMFVIPKITILRVCRSLYDMIQEADCFYSIDDCIYQSIEKAKRTCFERSDIFVRLINDVLYRNRACTKSEIVSIMEDVIDNE